MRYLIMACILAALLIAAGCTGSGEKTRVLTGVATTAGTTAPAPAVKVTAAAATTVPATTAALVSATPAATPAPRRITDGYWCRETTQNIGKAPTPVRECYRFAEDGTYTWGYAPGQPMGKSKSCSGDPGASCTWTLNAKGQYQVEGGYSFTLSGDALIDPHDPPYFLWTPDGIP